MTSMLTDYAPRDCTGCSFTFSDDPTIFATNVTLPDFNTILARDPTPFSSLIFAFEAEASHSQLVPGTFGDWTAFLVQNP